MIRTSNAGSRLLAVAWLGLLCGMRLAAATVTSSLPGFFTPQVAFSVSLTVAPDAGTRVQAIEETPPPGWTVGNLSHGGAWDAAAGKIKWGPFTDATPRVLSYRLTPSAGAVGSHAFAGQARFDADLVAVIGVRATTKFPGTLTRASPADHLPGVPFPVTLVAAPYTDVAAWAVEELVPEGWAVSNVTGGGGFDAANRKVKWGPFFDAVPRTLGYVLASPAASRSDAGLIASARFDEAVLTDTAALPVRPSRLARTMPATYRPGVVVSVGITATPAPFVRTYALEETLPTGWTPTTITAGGAWDATNRKIKWGPFADAEATTRTVSYQLTPAADEGRPLALSVTATFDARSVVSGGTIARLLVHPENSVTRVLPAGYSPGVAIPVTLTATPIDTGLVYAVEEEVPVGWTLTDISHGGALDPASRKIKWGPFFDATATVRALTYQAKPPADAFGSVAFVGTARFDGSVVAVTGATSVANLPGLVLRTLPSRYRPNLPFTVTLIASPVPGVVTYAVEEDVPAGWTVGSVSDGGAFDAINRKIKWGPFLDRDLRPLTYALTPDPAAAGARTFSGQGWFNAEASAVGGATTLVADRAPVAGADAVDRPLTASFKVSVFALLANDSDPDGDFLDLVSVSAQSAHGGRVELRWPWIYYTPVAGFTGIDTFTYDLSDRVGGTASATVTLNPVLPPGSPAQNIVSLESLAGGSTRIRFTGVPGFVYHIEVSPDTSVWTRVADRTADAVGQFEYLDATASSVPVRFYHTLWP